MLRSAAHSHRGYETEVIFGAACSRFRASGPVLHSLPPSPALRRPAEKIVRERELGSKTQPPKRVLHHNTQSKCTRKTHSDRRTPVSVRSILFRLSLWSSWSFCDLRYCRCMKNSWTSLASFRSRRRTQTSTSFTRLKASGQLPSLFTFRVFLVFPLTLVRMSLVLLAPCQRKLGALSGSYSRFYSNHSSSCCTVAFPSSPPTARSSCRLGPRRIQREQRGYPEAFPWQRIAGGSAFYYFMQASATQASKCKSLSQQSRKATPIAALAWMGVDNIAPCSSSLPLQVPQRKFFSTKRIQNCATGQRTLDLLFLHHLFSLLSSPAGCFQSHYISVASTCEIAQPLCVQSVQVPDNPRQLRMAIASNAWSWERARLVRGELEPNRQRLGGV